RREAEILTLARGVRYEVDKLVPRALQIIPSVTPDEVADFEANQQPLGYEATSLDYFRFHLEGKAKCLWNQSACRVFTQHMITEHGLPDSHSMAHAISNAFVTYLRTIQKRYREAQKAQALQLKNKIQNRRQARKYRVCQFQSMRYLAYVFAPLRKHINVLEEFGVDGMSSDESDMDDEGIVSYQSHVPQWRAEIVTNWLHLFDTLHHLLRRVDNGASTRGADPRYRKHLRKLSAKPTFVAGLPINAYNHQWLQANGQTRVQFLRPRGNYDFTHDPATMRYVYFL
ncbi:hypothetical protein C8F01DRAFT_1329213, partial [Mycena amicta]